MVPAVEDPDGEGGTVDLLLGQLQVQVLHHLGEVGILLCVHDHGALVMDTDGRERAGVYIISYLYDVSSTLNINSRMINRKKLDLLQISQSPK